MKLGLASIFASTSRLPTTPRPWTAEEDDLLRELVCQHGARRWNAVASAVPQRSVTECCARWDELQSRWSPLVRQPWTEHEGHLIRAFVYRHGARRWAIVSSFLPGRNGKQCRERWHNQLDPGINHNVWTDKEDALLVRLHRRLGNAWSQIAERLPGRTDNAVKNRWHSACLKTRTQQSPVSAHGKPRNNVKPWNNVKVRQHGCNVPDVNSPESTGDMSIEGFQACLDNEKDGMVIEVRPETPDRALVSGVGLELGLDWNPSVILEFTGWEGKGSEKDLAELVITPHSSSIAGEAESLSDTYWEQICVSTQDDAIMEALEPLDPDLDARAMAIQWVMERFDAHRLEGQVAATFICLWGKLVHTGKPNKV